MKTVKFILGAVAICSLSAGLHSCMKDKVSPQSANAGVANSGASASARMGTSWSQLYAVGNTPSDAWLYTLSSPPGVFSAIAVSGFSVGTTAVTDATGLAFANDTIIISTSSVSNFPDRLLFYPYPSIGTPLNAPVQVSCPKIKDIEYNEYNSTLYGIFDDLHIVSISSTGAITIDLSPAVPAGSEVSGLCNYNALLSYCINDGTPAGDEFYSYGPGGGLAPYFVFNTDWDGPPTDGPIGGAGTQYVDGFGWEIITENQLHKSVPAITLTGGPFASMSAPAGVIFADITSD